MELLSAVGTAKARANYWVIIFWSNYGDYGVIIFGLDYGNFRDHYGYVDYSAEGTIINYRVGKFFGRRHYGGIRRH